MICFKVIGDGGEGVGRCRDEIKLAMSLLRLIDAYMMGHYIIIVSCIRLKFLMISNSLFNDWSTSNARRTQGRQRHPHFCSVFQISCLVSQGNEE